MVKHMVMPVWKYVCLLQGSADDSGLGCHNQSHTDAHELQQVPNVRQETLQIFQSSYFSSIN